MEVKTSIKPVDYAESMKILEKRVEDVFINKKDELLWILEHKTVFTAGKSAKKKDLLNKKIRVIKTNRGGKYTVHSPGQKIIYFVLNLNKRGKDIRKLVRKVEYCIIDVLREYKIKSYADKKDIGIWVKKDNKEKKIAAIGIRVKKWVAYHGFSINLSNDLTLYKSIVPCGIKNKEMTNFIEIKVNNYNKIVDMIIKKFLKTFP
jgi:lipoyl(octanoyl) transferase